MELLRLSNIEKRYRNGDIGEIKVLDKINLTINEGEFIAILGKSGSGKSTLLYIMSGLSSPNNGTILFNGEDITAYNDKKMSHFKNNDIGFIFQSFFLEPSYNAWENVALPLIVKRINLKSRKKIAYEALRKVGLEGREMHKPSELSGGEMQRVCIARAIVSQPKIIFADEPTGNLDKVSGEMVMSVLCELAKEKTAIVLVTHDEQSAQMADRIIYISDGKLCEG